MRHLILSLVALVLIPFAMAYAAPEDEEPAPTKDEITVEYMKSVKKKLGKQDEGTARATATKLVEIWNDAEVGEKAKSDVPAFLLKVASSKDEMAAVAGIEGLTAVGGDDAAKGLMKVLQKALKAKEPSVQLYSACLKGLGVIASEDGKVIKELTKLTKHKDYDVVGKAASALAGYKDRPGKVRKELLEECIKQSEGVFNAQKGNDPGAKRKWNIIQSGIMKALNALSGQSFEDPTQARAWYNDHKKDRDLWK